MAIKIGIQLYSVRESFEKDNMSTLKKLSDIGYRYLEAANHHADIDDGVGFGFSAVELKKRLDDLGLQIVGSHINPLRLDRLSAVLDYHEKIGNKGIGCDIEFFPTRDIDYIKKRCELFNEVGKECKKRGMRYYYHNHFEEFQLINGKPIYDIIMENTDPEYVFCELDTYWIYRGGYNAVDYINKYKDRIVLLHQKDFPADAPQPMNMFDVVGKDASIDIDVFDGNLNPKCFTEIGTGVLPIQNILDEAQKCPNLDYMLLEQDFSGHSELESVELSFNAFKKFNGIVFK